MRVQEPLEFQDLAQLRDYVHRRLCREHDLEEHVFHMTQRLLVRGGTPCGVYFCLHGPRSVKLVAIWETEHNCLWFYDSRGQRILCLPVRRGPALAKTS